MRQWWERKGREIGRIKKRKRNWTEEYFLDKYIGYKKTTTCKYRIIFIPEGYAHGFITLSKKAIVSYKISNKYNRKYEKTIFWNDKRLKLILPKKIQKKIIISKKDCEKKN